MRYIEKNNCKYCKYLVSGICLVRNEKIGVPEFTWCRNSIFGGPTPMGVLYVLSEELKYGKPYIRQIPYYNGIRVETFQRIPGKTVVVIDKPGKGKLIFNSVDEYFVYYDNERVKKKNMILGGVIGDVIGSVFEFDNVKTTDFHLFCDETTFTDDTVLSVATMDCLLNSGGYTEYYRKYSHNYPNRGYGTNFHVWILDNDPKPYNSWGNGSAMRVSPVGWAFDTLEEVLAKAEESASVTHNHPEGVKGAQATAAAVFLARTGKTKPEIREYTEQTFGYDLSRTIDQIRPGYKFNESCAETVPEAITAFLESDGFESAIRLAVSLGGDSDTLACITGSIAEAFYDEIPLYMIETALKRLPPDLIDVISEFSGKFRPE